MSNTLEELVNNSNTLEELIIKHNINTDLVTRDNPFLTCEQISVYNSMSNKRNRLIGEALEVEGLGGCIRDFDISGENVIGVFYTNSLFLLKFLSESGLMYA
jgi:hypothetical protein